MANYITEPIFAVIGVVDGAVGSAQLRKPEALKVSSRARLMSRPVLDTYDAVTTCRRWVLTPGESG